MKDPEHSARRVTISDVATAAGVSHSTVSRALRGSPLIRKETREKLNRLAEEMGYRPDPMLSALTSYRSRIQIHKQNSALAFVRGPYYIKAWEEIIESAKHRARRLGYDLQEYIWRDDMSSARQSQILRTRGVRGIVVGPLTEDNQAIELPLRIDHFSFVAIGRFVSHPLINTVTPNHYASVAQAIAALQKRGYERIGLAIHERLNRHVDDRLRASFLACQTTMREDEKVPPCLYDDGVDERTTILQWIETTKPQVVLSYSHIFDHLIEEGIEIPGQLAFASLNLNHEYEGRVAGTNVNDKMVGQAAIDLLHSQLMMGEIGSVKIRQTVVLDTYWQDGHSAPSRH